MYLYDMIVRYEYNHSDFIREFESSILAKLFSISKCEWAKRKLDILSLGLLAATKQFMSTLADNEELPYYQLGRTINNKKCTLDDAKWLTYKTSEDCYLGSRCFQYQASPIKSQLQPNHGMEMYLSINQLPSNASVGLSHAVEGWRNSDKCIMNPRGRGISYAMWVLVSGKLVPRL